MLERALRLRREDVDRHLVVLRRRLLVDDLALALDLVVAEEAALVVRALPVAEARLEEVHAERPHVFNLLQRLRRAVSGAPHGRAKETKACRGAGRVGEGGAGSLLYNKA